MLIIRDHCISQIEPEQNNYILKQGFTKSFYSENIVTALRGAQDYGSILTLPQFLQARCLATFDDPLWNLPFTVQTEEIVGKTKAGAHVGITVHGAGLLTPERIQLAKETGLTRNPTGKNEFAVPLYDPEIHALLEGNPLSGDINIYSYLEFEKGIHNLPERYAVVRDFHPRMELPEGENYIGCFYHLPRLVTAAGGVEELRTYLDIVRIANHSDRVSHFHPYRDIDVEQPQGRLLGAGGFYFLLDSCMEMDGSARFLTIRKENLEERIDTFLNISL